MRRVGRGDLAVRVEDVLARREVRRGADASIPRRRLEDAREQLLAAHVAGSLLPHDGLTAAPLNPREEVVLVVELDDLAAVPRPVEGRGADEPGIAEEPLFQLDHDVLDEKGAENLLSSLDVCREIRKRRQVSRLRRRDVRRVHLRLVFGLRDGLLQLLARPALALHPVRHVALLELRDRDDLDRLREGAHHREDEFCVVLALLVVVREDDDALALEELVERLVPLARASRIARRDDIDAAQRLHVLLALHDVDRVRLDDGGEVVEKVGRVAAPLALVRALVEYLGLLADLEERLRLLVSVHVEYGPGVLVLVLVGRLELVACLDERFGVGLSRRLSRRRDRRHFVAVAERLNRRERIREALDYHREVDDGAAFLGLVVEPERTLE